MKGKLEKIIVLPNLLVAMTICTVSDLLEYLHDQTLLQF